MSCSGREGPLQSGWKPSLQHCDWGSLRKQLRGQSWGWIHRASRFFLLFGLHVWNGRLCELQAVCTDTAVLHHLSLFYFILTWRPQAVLPCGLSVFVYEKQPFICWFHCMSAFIKVKCIVFQTKTCGSFAEPGPSVRTHCLRVLQALSETIRGLKLWVRVVSVGLQPLFRCVFRPSETGKCNERRRWHQRERKKIIFYDLFCRGRSSCFVSSAPEQPSF